jgi:hypothetical protein
VARDRWKRENVWSLKEGDFIRFKAPYLNPKNNKMLTGTFFGRITELTLVPEAGVVQTDILLTSGARKPMDFTSNDRVYRSLPTLDQMIAKARRVPVEPQEVRGYYVRVGPVRSSEWVKPIDGGTEYDRELVRTRPLDPPFFTHEEAAQAAIWAQGRQPKAEVAIEHELYDRIWQDPTLIADQGKGIEL